MNTLVTGTTREPARALIRLVATLAIAGAFSCFFWFDDIAAAILAVFWSLVFFGPVFAWPLTFGRITGGLVAGAGLVIIALAALAGGNGGATAGDTLFVFAACVPLFLTGALMTYPQTVIALIRRLVRT